MLFWFSMLLNKRSSYSWPIKPNIREEVWTRHFFSCFFWQFFSCVTSS
jgi:hypothetical protein